MGCCSSKQSHGTDSYHRRKSPQTSSTGVYSDQYREVQIRYGNNQNGQWHSDYDDDLAVMSRDGSVESTDFVVVLSDRAVRSSRPVVSRQINSNSIEPNAHENSFDYVSTKDMTKSSLSDHEGEIPKPKKLTKTISLSGSRTIQSKPLNLSATENSNEVYPKNVDPYQNLQDNHALGSQPAGNDDDNVSPMEKYNTPMKVTPLPREQSSSHRTNNALQDVSLDDQQDDIMFNSKNTSKLDHFTSNDGNVTPLAKFLPPAAPQSQSVQPKPVNFDDMPINSTYHRIHSSQAAEQEAKRLEALRLEAETREREIQEFKAAMLLDESSK